MSDTFKWMEKRTCRKAFRCHASRVRVEAGDTYWYSCGVNSGDFWTIKLCDIAGRWLSTPEMNDEITAICRHSDGWDPDELWGERRQYPSWAEVSGEQG